MRFRLRGTGEHRPRYGSDDATAAACGREVQHVTLGTTGRGGGGSVGSALVGRGDDSRGARSTRSWRCCERAGWSCCRRTRCTGWPRCRRRGTRSSGVFALKGRRADVPLAVLCASAAQALALAEPVAGVDAVAARFWPGPLTLVLPRRAGRRAAPRRAASTRSGCGCPTTSSCAPSPSGPGPIAATSANRHGEPTPPTAAEAAASLDGEPDLVVDGGPLEASASTVVDATTAPRGRRCGTGRSTPPKSSRPG